LKEVIDTKTEIFSSRSHFLLVIVGSAIAFLKKRAIALSFNNCRISDRLLKKRAITLSFNNCRISDRLLKKRAIALHLT